MMMMHRAAGFLGAFGRRASSAVAVTSRTKKQSITKIQKQDAKEPVNFKVILEKTRLCDLAKMDQDAEAFLKVAANKFEGRNDEDQPTHIDWNNAMEAIKQAEHHFPIQYFESDELEDIKEQGITFNLAKVINGSFTLKKLVDLGVDISYWESSGWTNAALTLDFERDVVPKALLLRDLILTPTAIAGMFTRSLELLQQDVADLKVRIDYLTSKSFSPAAVRQIVSEDPSWLTFPAAEIDARLGYFQKLFSLSGAEVRSFAVALPQLVTWAGVPGQIRVNHFALREICGFSKDECRQMFLAWPVLYKKRSDIELRKMFDFLHNEVGFPHHLLAKFPECLTEHYLQVGPRHAFLQKLARDQYDPKEPNYVSPKALVLTSDLEFCQSVAKQSVDVFNDFLKTV